MTAEIVDRLQWSFDVGRADLIDHTAMHEIELRTIQNENAALKRDLERSQMWVKQEQDARVKAEKLQEDTLLVMYGYQDVLENMRGQTLHYIGMVRSLTDFVLKSKGPAPEGWVNAATSMLKIVSDAHDRLTKRPGFETLNEERLAEGARMLARANETLDKDEE
jgi:hypothetical protein